MKKSSKLTRRKGDAAFNRSFGLMVGNFLASRAKLASQLSGSTLVSESESRTGFFDPPGRDLDRECGYPCTPTVEHYRRLYDREGYASRVVNIWPDECWAVRPLIYETEDARITKFERAWSKLNRRINLLHYLHRADRLSGIGTFGVLLLGLDDGRKLSMPAAGIRPDGMISKKRPKKNVQLLYVRPFSEENVSISEVEQDRTSPRYGQPTLYSITVVSPCGDGEAITDTLKVHWTRVVHLADNRESSEIAGIPRIRPVLNRLLDLRKLLSASAEMFYKGGFPGYSFETVPELIGESTMTEDTVREQFDEYMEGLKRYLALDGVTAKSLSPQVADPTAHVMAQLTTICATIGVPLRIFLGTESGHLASSQDTLNWNKRVFHRQETYLEPMVIRSTVDRLIALGVLPEVEDYIIEWKDLNTMSDESKADVTLKKAQALMQYVSGKVEDVIPPHEFLTLYMGHTAEEADAIIKALDKAIASGKRYTAKEPDPIELAKETAKIKTATNPTGPASKTKSMGGSKIKISKPQGGGRTGNPPKAKASRPAGKALKGAAK